MARPPKVSKEIRDLVQAAKDAGWAADRTRNNHLRLRSPNGEAAVVVPLRSGDWRNRNNLRADLKRHGVAL